MAVQGLLLFITLVVLGWLLSQMEWFPSHNTLGYIAAWALAFSLAWTAMQGWRRRQQRG
ncbi:hypothetical protein [Mobilicoccus pelagius]|uniref:hypothetical protein n=1 Tax=Mobilicoccus pelagius TaxID=746032 RepID=UPI00145FBD6C|nr:hypothetical protein [Mobilicoccus pelagius]